MLSSDAISVNSLTYAHNSFSEPSLVDVRLHLPKGSRTILIGANGGSYTLILLWYNTPELITIPISWQVHPLADPRWKAPRHRS